MTPLLVIIALAIVIFVYLSIALTYWKRQNLPYSLSHGYVSQWGKTFAVDHKYVRKMGKLFGTYDLHTPVLVVAKPELIQQVLVKESDKFLERKNCPKSEDSFKNSTLVSKRTGSFQYGTHRRVIGKLFADSKNLVEMCKHCMGSDHEMLEMVGRITSIENYLDFAQILNIYLVKKYVHMCFGIAIDQNIKNQIIKYFEFLVKTPDIDTYKEIEPWFVPNFLAYVVGKTSVEQKVWQQIRQLVAEIYANRDRKGCNNSLLYMLSDADNQSDLTKDHYIDDSLLFSVLGCKTSISVVSNLIYHLSHSQSAQNKLIKEIDDYIKGQQKSSHDFMCPKKEGHTPEGEAKEPVPEVEFSEEELESQRQEYLSKIMALPYLDACIKEILRLYPPVTRLVRKSSAGTVLDGIKVAKGTDITIPVYAVHRDKDNFDQPDTFKPERFLAKADKPIKPGTYIPFGDGPRNCAGQQLAMLATKITMINIFNRFRLVKSNLTKELKFHSNSYLFSSMTPISVIVKVVQRNKTILD